MRDDDRDTPSEGLAAKIARLLEEQRRRRPPAALERATLERLKKLEREAFERAGGETEEGESPADGVGALIALIERYEQENFAPLDWFEPMLASEGGLGLRLDGAASSVCRLHRSASDHTSPGFLVRGDVSLPDDAKHTFTLELEYSGLSKHASRLRISWALAPSLELDEEHQVGFDFVGLRDASTLDLHESRVYPDMALAGANPDGFDPLYPSNGDIFLTRAELGFSPHRVVLARLVVVGGEAHT